MILTLKQIIKNKNILDNLSKTPEIFYYEDKTFKDKYKLVVVFEKKGRTLKFKNLKIMDITSQDAKDYLFLITNYKNPKKWGSQYYSLYGFSIIDNKNNKIKDNVNEIVEKFLKNIENIGFKIENKEKLVNVTVETLISNVEQKSKKSEKLIEKIKVLTFEIEENNVIKKPFQVVNNNLLQIYIEKNFGTIKKEAVCVLCNEKKNEFVDKINNLFPIFTFTSDNKIVSQIPIRFGTTQKKIKENISLNVCKECGEKLLRVQYIIDFSSKDPYFKIEEDIFIKIFPYYINEEFLKENNNAKILEMIIKDFYSLSGKELTFEDLITLIYNSIKKTKDSEEFDLFEFNEIKNNLMFDIIFYKKDKSEVVIYNWITNIELKRILKLKEKLKNKFAFLKSYYEFRKLFEYKQLNNSKNKKLSDSEKKLIRNLYFDAISDLLLKEEIKKQILDYLIKFYWKKYRNYIMQFKSREEKSFISIYYLFDNMDDPFYKLAEEIGKLTFNISLEKVKKLRNKRIEEFNKEDWERVYKQPYIKKVFLNSKFRTVRDLINLFNYLMEKATYLNVPISKELRELVSKIEIKDGNKKLDETLIKYYIIKGFYGK